MSDGLSVRGLRVDYGPLRAVDGVDLDVRRGEVVALLGPSGCGKSSLLRAVAGLEPVVAGSVAFDGTDVAGVPVHRRGFGLLFQDGQLFVHRDVAGNVGYGLPRRPGRDARVRELLDLVGLGDAGRRDVATLSGGEQQRVALARALAPAPQLLLVDEPLSALDRALRERLADELRAILVGTGTTALYVTHDQDEAFAVADRVAVMADGRLLQVDTPAALWRSPASVQVAGFLGYQAFVPADGPAARPFLAALGVAAHDGVVALAPGALVPAGTPGVAAGSGAPDGGGSDGDPGDGLAVAVTGRRVRRGRLQVVGELPGVGPVSVDVRAGDQVAETLRVRVNPDAVALL